jgi:hypothetical protein
MEIRMRRFAFILLVPLAACASVEERTDARSGSGFSSTTITGAQGPQSSTTSATMRGFDAVPAVTVRSGATTQDAAARAALAAGGSSSGDWVPVTTGGTTYAMRLVNADGFNFAVAESQGSGGLTDGLIQQASIRTGCLAVPGSWQEGKRFAMALDCS